MASPVNRAHIKERVEGRRAPTGRPCSVEGQLERPYAETSRLNAVLPLGGETAKYSLLRFPLCSCDPSPALFTRTGTKSLPGPSAPAAAAILGPSLCVQSPEGLQELCGGEGGARGNANSTSNPIKPLPLPFPL